MALGWTGASPVTRVRFRGQRVHVKRDDVFHLAGNKMRKLFWFLQQDAAFYQDAHLVSFGGTQSNAMLAIAQLAHAKRVPFTYFSRALERPPQAATALYDNLSAAKELGMRHCELATDEYHALAASKDLAGVLKRHGASALTRPVLIPQGAAFPHAEHGLKVLAHELNAYCAAAAHDGARFSVVVPSGTGTTAFYLAQHVDPARLRVLAVPCVGDSDYLSQQFDALAALHPERAHQLHKPELLVPSAKARFGRLAWPLLDMYSELKHATAIEFDLLYAAFAWQTLFEPHNLAIAREECHGTATSAASTQPGATPREILYLHTGGVSGNGSMLVRYQLKARNQPKPS